jgi:type IV secretory pathway TrbL component
VFVAGGDSAAASAANATIAAAATFTVAAAAAAAAARRQLGQLGMPRTISETQLPSAADDARMRGNLVSWARPRTGVKCCKFPVSVHGNTAALSGW